MNYLSPFFINFYLGMGLLTEAEKQKFPLERKIARLNDKGVLGNDKVVSNKDDIEPTLPLAKVNMSENDIEE